MTASAASSGPLVGGFKVEIESLIFDDADPTGTALLSINHTNVASSYTEFNPVPEPSSLALLTLGAGGILLRRKRKAAGAA